jgi:hypothetical protein
MSSKIEHFPEKELQENLSENRNLDYNPVENTINLGKFSI